MQKEKNISFKQANIGPGARTSHQSKLNSQSQQDIKSESSSVKKKSNNTAYKSHKVLPGIWGMFVIASIAKTF